MRSIDIQNRPLVLRTNYGDDSIALVQWAFEAGLSGRVVYVDTGWAAASWKEERVPQGEQHARDCGFESVQLISKISFADAVIGRQAFPSEKFQWCTGLLKGLPFLDWLEPQDLSGEVIIMMAKRRANSVAHAELLEWIPHCQYHGDRVVWHPLIEIDDLERNALLERAGFSPLQHRSLECEPCINASISDLNNMNLKDKQKVKKLAAKVNADWPKAPTHTQHYLDLFYRGCGNHFGCGL